MHFCIPDYINKFCIVLYRPASEMPLKWRFSDRPLHACLVALWFFWCSGPLLLRNLIGLWISMGGGGSGTMPPLDPHIPLLYTVYYFNFITQCSNSLTRDCSNRKNRWKGGISFVKKYRWKQYASWFQDFYSCFWWLKNGDWDFSQVLLFYIGNPSYSLYYEEEADVLGVCE